MPLIVAVVNSRHESLEIMRWVKGSEDDIKRIENEMLALVARLYPKLSQAGYNNREEVMTAVGCSGTRSNSWPDRSDDMIHYALYEGRCLDPKALTYFLPEKTVKEGNLTLDEVRKILVG